MLSGRTFTKAVPVKILRRQAWEVALLSPSPYLGMEGMPDICLEMMRKADRPTPF